MCVRRVVGRPCAPSRTPRSPGRARRAPRTPRRTPPGSAALATGSVWTQSLGPRESSSRWSVVPPSTWSRRWITGPLNFDSPRRGHLRRSASRAAAARNVRCAPPGTYSSCLWASIGSPGPKFTAGMPRAVNRATSVQPNFGFTSPPTASMNAFAAGRSSPGSAPGALSVSAHVVPLEEVADELPRPPPRCGPARTGG